MRCILRPRKHPAFTLIEVLIVVAILGIVAALAMPEWANARTEAKESGLATDLQTARKQIEIYRSQHGGRAPHLDENGQEDTANFVARLMGQTDAQGHLGSGALGPYLTEWPANPFAGSSSAGSVKFGSASAPPRDGTSGWYYSTTSCTLSANTASGAKDYDPPADPSPPLRR
jgi:prepilin-type N-terminal cleavage/methylation domain-containing protein